MPSFFSPFSAPMDSPSTEDEFRALIEIAHVSLPEDFDCSLARDKNVLGRIARQVGISHRAFSIDIDVFWQDVPSSLDILLKQDWLSSASDNDVTQFDAISAYLGTKVAYLTGKDVTDEQKARIAEWCTRAAHGNYSMFRELISTHNEADFVQLLEVTSMTALLDAYKSLAVGRPLFDDSDPLSEADYLKSFQQLFECQTESSIAAYLGSFISGVATAFTEAPSNYLAPFFAVVQRSGVGKSFTAIEYAKNNYCAYVSLMKEDAPRCPSRSRTASLWTPPKDFVRDLLGNCDFIAYYLALMTAYMSLARKSIARNRQTPNEWLGSQEYLKGMDGLVFAKKLIIEFSKVICAIVDLARSETQMHDIAPAYRLYIAAAMYLNNEAKRLETFFGKQPSTKSSTNEPSTFTFIVDEAASLLENVYEDDPDCGTFFDYLRIAAHLVPVSTDCTRLVFAFVDRSPWIMEPLGYYAMSSVVWIEGKELFPTFIAFPGQPHERSAFAYSDRIESLSNMGCYLWKSLPVGKVLEVAEYKLLGEPLERATLGMTSATALLAPRLGLRYKFIFPPKRYKYELVRSHSAMLCNVSADHQNCTIGYPHDVLLGCASASILMESRQLNWFALCQYMIMLIRKGTIRPTEHGTLAMRILFLMTMDCARINQKKQSFEEIKVEHFLEELIGKDATKKVRFVGYASRRRFMNGCVNLNQFHIAKKGTPHPSSMPAFYRRRSAILYPENHPCFDLIIPVRLDDMDGDAYSFIIVQSSNGFIRDFDEDILVGLGINVSTENDDHSVDLETESEHHYSFTEPYMYMLLQTGVYDEEYAETNAKFGSSHGSADCTLVNLSNISADTYKILNSPLLYGKDEHDGPVEKTLIREFEQVLKVSCKEYFDPIELMD